MDYQAYDIYWVFLNPGESELEQLFRKSGYSTYVIHYSSKKDLLPALYKSVKLLRKIKPDIVHAHLFEASLIGMAAARICGVKQRIYTRHHSSFHHADHPQAVKYDRMINRLSTHIIAVSGSVERVLTNLESVPSSRISVVHHGFELEKFATGNINSERLQQLSAKYNPGNKRPVIGVISRYIRWKGLQHIIPAFKEVLKHYPDALLILANAQGSYKKEVTALLQELPRGSYREIEFENDIFALYHLFDVFIHAPIREDAEAFGQIYIEAMAAKVAIVATLAGIASDILKHKENAWLVPFCDEKEIAAGVIAVLEDKTGTELMTKNAYNTIISNFTVESMIKKLEAVYER